MSAEEGSVVTREKAAGAVKYPQARNVTIERLADNRPLLLRRSLMTVHLYLSLIPEALIASMLPPEEFAVYYTVGYTKRRRGQAMFVELDPNFRHDFFRIEEGIARCVPHEDGRPKKSVYIATYRVLEHSPLTDVNTLYLVTRYGQSLRLSRSDDYVQGQNGLYMYQEIAPVSPLVVSSLDPVDFYRFLTQEPQSLIHLPA